MKRLAGIDAAFLYMETPTTHMHVAGTMILDPSTIPGGYSYERMARAMISRFAVLEPMRKRLVDVPFGIDHPVWVDDPGFRPTEHIRRVHVPAPGTERELAEVVGRAASEPMDRSRPLWEIWVLEGLAEGRIALITRLHHAILDGMAGAALMGHILDISPDVEIPEQLPAPQPLEPEPTAVQLLGQAVLERLVDPVALARTSLQTGRALLPLLRESMFGREDDAPPRPTLPFAAPRTAFNNAISSRRVTAFGKTNLETVKAVRKAFDCKVNDVVLAACTMSLRRYLEAHHDLPAESLVASVPVSVRPESAGEDLGNRVSTMFVGLPVHVADPLEQLEIITEDSRRAKELRSSFGDELLRDWAELAPPRLFEEGARLWGNLKIADRTRPVHNLVISNVPGPPMPFYAGGARVVGIYPFGPILEGAGMNITVFSTQGSMDIGVIACPRAVADPWDIVRGFEQAVEELAELATTGGKLPRRVEDREQRAREMSFRRTPRREVS